MICLNDTEKELLLLEIIIWVCDEAKSKGEVKSLLKGKFPEITEDESADLIQQSIEKLARLHNDQNDPKAIIQDHVAKYEYIFAYFQKIGHAAGCNKALAAKERLLNLVNDQSRFTLKRTETIVQASSANVEYDINRLNPQQQERLMFLLNKARVS